MKASENLRQEHVLIQVALNVLEKVTSKIQQNETVEVSDLIEIVHFLIEYSDKSHHGKEEVYYFPTLEKAGIPKDGGPIGMMLHEHELGRKNIRQMKESLSGKSTDFQSFAEAATSYITLLRNHIDKENNILFRMGDQRLPEDQQKSLLDEFEKHEETVFGAGKSKELLEKLERLVERYLVV